MVAAAYALGQGRSGRASRLHGLAVLAGALGIWLPWGLYMNHLYGSFVPSPVLRPTFGGGPWAVLLFPGAVLTAVLMAVPDFAIGLLCPFWLFASLRFTHSMMLAGGWFLTLGVLVLTVTRPPFRFAGAGFAALFLLVVSQVLFRDMTAILLLARYTPIAAVLLSFAVAEAYAPPFPAPAKGPDSSVGRLYHGHIRLYLLFLPGGPPRLSGFGADW